MIQSDGKLSLLNISTCFRSVRMSILPCSRQPSVINRLFGYQSSKLGIQIICSRDQQHWCRSSFPRRIPIDRHERKKRGVSSCVVNVEERSRRVGRTVDATSPIFEHVFVGENGNEIRPRVTEHPGHPRGNPRVDQVEYRLSPDSYSRGNF